LAASQSSSKEHGQGDTTTYFDSVVFLTMFLLAGEYLLKKRKSHTLRIAFQGRFLEAYSKSRTADAITSLGKLRPSQALLLSPTPAHSNSSSPINLPEIDIERGDPDMDDLRTKPGMAIEMVDPKMLEVGDVVRVPRGSTPPADGTIVVGETFFDESSLTGESKPVRKAVSDRVFLGTINQGRVVDTRIDVIGGQTM
jgi:P-type Cu+ transporter